MATQALPLKHQSVAGRATAKLRWRGTAAPYTDGQVVARHTGFDIHHPHVPLPHVQGVANVEELLLAVQLELVEGLGLRLPAEAVELLPMDTNNKAQITPPSQNGAEDIVKVWELHLIGDRDQANDHRAHMTQNCSQNQAFKRLYFNHSSRLRRSA